MAGEATALRGLRILIVEDAFLIAIDLCAKLESCGCTVVGPAGRLSQALRLAKEERLDGALLDVNLNGQMSFPVAEALRARNVPFVFASGYDDKSVWPREFWDIPTVTKPYSFPELTSVLARSIPSLA
jgi:CheY-like chemotaxis protein